MKILSTGDLHIGTECDPDVAAALEEIISIGHKEKPELVVITGDIYNSTSTPSQRRTAARIIKRLADITEVAIIKGNHDAPQDLLIFNEISDGFGIKVFERPGMLFYGGPERALSVHLIPWFTKAAWIASKVGDDFTIESGNEAVSILAMAYLRAQIAEAKQRGCSIHVIFGHLTIAGSLVENHQPLLGEGITLGYQDLQGAGFSAGAFGHIHLSQEFGKPGEPMFVYNGAPAALNYGESCLNKRVSILDTDTMKFQWFQLNSVKRLTFDAIWDGKLTVENADIDGPKAFENSRVRVKMLVEEGYNPEDGENAIREFVSRYGAPLDLKIERATKPKDSVRSEEIAKAKTAAEKLEAYWKATNTTPEEPMRSDMLWLAAEIEAQCKLK